MFDFVFYTHKIKFVKTMEDDVHIITPYVSLVFKISIYKKNMFHQYNRFNPQIKNFLTFKNLKQFLKLIIKHTFSSSLLGMVFVTIHVLVFYKNYSQKQARMVRGEISIPDNRTHG